MLSDASRKLPFLLLLIVSSPAVSQDFNIPEPPEHLHLAPQPSDRFPAEWYPHMDAGANERAAPVEDRPFTAKYGIIEPSATTTADSRSTGFRARDRFGRTRSDAENGSMRIGEQEVRTKTVNVSDPVSHCDFYWTEPVVTVDPSPSDRVAYVECGPRALRFKEFNVFKTLMELIPDGTTTNGDTTTKTEHLAPVKRDGLTILRLRVTNSRTDVHGQSKQWSRETWYSPELEELVGLGSDEEGYQGLTSIERKDPDPALFYPPEGYRIELKPST
jgi:hypothetical protein